MELYCDDAGASPEQSRRNDSRPRANIQNELTWTDSCLGNETISPTLVQPVPAPPPPSRGHGEP